MQSPNKKRALIIGAGIGGVTAALALRQAGLAVTVFERAEQLREVGSALPLWMNALRALEKLGITDQVSAIGRPVTSAYVTTWRGEKLAHINRDHLFQKPGTLSMAVSRPELLDVLGEALGVEHIQLGTRYPGFTQKRGQVCAHFADGREVHGDVLIGADGVHSATRAQLFGKAMPRYAGYTCWRGIARIAREGIETWAWGNRMQFGVIPMSRGRAYWFAQQRAPEGEAEQEGWRKCAVWNLFAQWPDPIPAVIEATEETQILRNDIYETEPLPHWSRGQVTLLGDAAHTMTPDLGQGACQAIEDAVVLGACLRSEPDTVLALKQYEARRLSRTKRVALLARLIGQAIHTTNPVVAVTRDFLIRTIPERLLVQRFLWIFDYNEM